MGHKFPQKEIELYKVIDEILWNDWDPIGVNEFPDVRDEYYSYLPKIYSMTLENSTSFEIANYLFMIEKDHMGCPSTLENCISIAEKIKEAQKKIVG